jgi:hypothetical protein
MCDRNISCSGDCEVITVVLYEPDSEYNIFMDHTYSYRQVLATISSGDLAYVELSNRIGELNN